jgi:hypothetical protein
VIWIASGVALSKVYVGHVTQPINSESRMAQTQSHLLGWMVGQFEKRLEIFFRLELRMIFSQKNPAGMFSGRNISLKLTILTKIHQLDVCLRETYIYCFTNRKYFEICVKLLIHK